MFGLLLSKSMQEVLRAQTYHERHLTIAKTRHVVFIFDGSGCLFTRRTLLRKSRASLPWPRGHGTSSQGVHQDLQHEIEPARYISVDFSSYQRPKQLSLPFKKSVNSICSSAPVSVSRPACELGSPGRRYTTRSCSSSSTSSQAMGVNIERNEKGSP